MQPASSSTSSESQASAIKRSRAVSPSVSENVPLWISCAKIPDPMARFQRVHPHVPRVRRAPAFRRRRAAVVASAHHTLSSASHTPVKSVVDLYGAAAVGVYDLKLDVAMRDPSPIQSTVASVDHRKVFSEIQTVSSTGTQGVSL